MLVPGFDSDLNKRLADLRRRNSEPVAAAEVAQIVEGVVRALYNANNGSTFDLKMFGEIEALFRFIQKAKSEIAALRPDKINDEQIPLATDELNAVIRVTETATATILDEAEKLDRLATAVGGASATEIGESVTRIYEACSFQDITGQRISKVVATLRNIEDRVDGILQAFGEELGQLSIAKVAPTAPAMARSDKPERPDAHLLNGPQMPDKASKQSDIDAILASAG